MASEVGPNQFRRACSQFLTGVTVVTSRSDDGALVGLTVSSFTSVSLDPPLVLMCISKNAPSHGAFRIGRVCAVHVLAEDQTGLSVRFSAPRPDKFEGLPIRDGLNGVPILSNYLALFECRVLRPYDGGDHTIFLAQVERLDIAEDERNPLGIFRSSYTRSHNLK